MSGGKDRMWNVGRASTSTDPGRNKRACRLWSGWCRTCGIGTILVRRWEGGTNSPKLGVLPRTDADTEQDGRQGGRSLEGVFGRRRGGC